MAEHTACLKLPIAASPFAATAVPLSSSLLSTLKAAKKTAMDMGAKILTLKAAAAEAEKVMSRQPDKGLGCMLFA